MQQDNTIQIPHLCAEKINLQQLESKFLQHEQVIEDWFKLQWENSPPPVYGSVDLRNAGFKLAPIDMNLFPAGFNNLNRDYLSYSVDAARRAITHFYADAKKILLVPENHTRNLFYWENMHTLLHIIQQAGFDVRVGSLSAEITSPLEINLSNNKKILVEPLVRKDNKVGVENFIADLVLLNNDLSDGIPAVLQNLDQLLLPPAELGWSQRLKSEHFQYYANVSQEFADFMQIDPWLLAPLFRHCGNIDFMKREGDDCLEYHIENLFAAIQKKYDEYHIKCKPFIIVKADAGTYGMAVMTVRNIDEIRHLNRKQRTRMSTIKGGQPVRQVIIQEGIYTFETWGSDNAVAEPVVYLWGKCVVGGFYRVHKEKGIDESLNAPGMQFEPLAFSRPCHQPIAKSTDECQNRFYVYGVVARLSMLAAAREMLELK